MGYVIGDCRERRLVRAFEAGGKGVMARESAVSDCGCPLSEKDRYDLWLRYVDPQSGVVLREEVRKGLSAEEVGRLVEFVEVERR